MAMHMQAQPIYPVTRIPVSHGSTTLTNPWCGGFNAPQLSTIDLNNDGIKDLFVFDRAGDKVSTWLNDGSGGDAAYHYAPEYEALFPPLTWWAVLRDYNGDGIEDIFTYQPGENDPQGHAIPTCIKVYKGSRVNGQVHFDVLQYGLKYSDGNVNAYFWTNSLGIPAFVDADHDGDLDVLAFNVYGAAVEYYENQSADLHLPGDSMRFVYALPCWGNFMVSGNDLHATYPVSCKGGIGANDGDRHSGATLWAFDNEDDGDIDLLVSGDHTATFQLMKNCGTAANANICADDTVWPACSTPVNLPYFPAAFELDADNDGLKDLLIAPNFSLPSPAIDVRNIYLMKKQLGGCNYIQTQGDSFLTHTILDFGTDAKATFFDYDNDGLQDIVVGNYKYYNPVVTGYSKLALLKNTGTATTPSFDLVSEDFAQLSNFNLLGAYPAFGDLDGDGLPDMLLGVSSGYLHLFKNTGNANTSYTAMTFPFYDSLKVNDNAAPFIYDVNEDSLLDIVVGSRDGSLTCYLNTGSKTQPVFQQQSGITHWGNINVATALGADGNSQPFLCRTANDSLLLFVGSEAGYIYQYLINTDSIQGGTFRLIDSNFLKRDAGGRINFSMADLNNDGKMEYLLGNARGGLQLFSETKWDSAVGVQQLNGEQLSFNLYPNPATEEVRCKMPEGKYELHVVDIMGRQQTIPQVYERGEAIMKVGEWPAGIYFVYVKNGFKTACKKLVVEHLR